VSIDLKTETIEVQTSDLGTLPLFIATPDGTPKGAVVVIQEAFGITSHIQDIATRLARAGWLGVAPALFHRQGSPVPVFAYDDFESVMPAMKQLTGDGITADLDATFEYLGSVGFPAAATGIVGFCMGGSVSLYAATRHAVGAAVTFYGSGIKEGRFGFPPLVELAPTLKAPWLGLFGDLDKGIPADDVESLRSAAKTSGKLTEVVRYPDADHGFNCTDRPSVYNAEAAADAWSRTLIWFADHVVR
jgi:carboxymethylenebutenolidase